MAVKTTGMQSRRPSRSADAGRLMRVTEVSEHRQSVQTRGFRKVRWFRSSPSSSCQSFAPQTQGSVRGCIDPRTAAPSTHQTHHQALVRICAHTWRRKERHPPVPVQRRSNSAQAPSTSISATVLSSPILRTCEGWNSCRNASFSNTYSASR